MERGNLILDGTTLYVEFTSQEATVPAMTLKVKTELNTEENVVLCDGQGNRLAESSGTTGTLEYF